MINLDVLRLILNMEASCVACPSFQDWGNDVRLARQTVIATIAAACHHDRHCESKLLFMNISNLKKWSGQSQTSVTASAGHDGRMRTELATSVVTKFTDYICNTSKITACTYNTYIYLPCNLSNGTRSIYINKSMKHCTESCIMTM